MTKIMSYNQAVLEIREEVANREHFIISGTAPDMTSAMRMLGVRHCTVWITSDFGPYGVFKVDSSEVDAMDGISKLIAMVISLVPMELGIVASVPKIEGLPDEFPSVPGKDLLSLNANMPIMVAEAMRTVWPDDTVLLPEETVKAVMP